ncbi:hypothetical protein SCLCIDRAFT_17033 [Scleroderma citrinum Foug A]|uniref:Cytochrome b561 domain-containing protein n=1 Tax=Scleroderma citrinum Foug A TaxID=1036808 RepID=A0A0C3DM02_9AGAM|nr:hypothetical protein SCLCIDRAFT_17033 [Scleroderma citrinum Foug A]
MGSSPVMPEGRKGDVVAKYAVLVLIVTSWGIVFTNDPAALGWFSFHPIFQSSAIAFFTYGILTLQPTSHPATKAAALQRHQITMLGFGIPCIVLGTSAMIRNKSLHSAPHFTSWHGTCGIMTFTWLIVQATFGAASVWYGGAALGGGVKAKALWKYHRLSGYLLLALMLSTASLAGNETYWVTHNSPALARFVSYTLAPLVILVGVYSRIR